eukprot:UN31668
MSSKVVIELAIQGASNLGELGNNLFCSLIFYS